MESLLFQKTTKILLKKFKKIPQLAIITGSGIKLFRNQEPSFQTKYNSLPLWSKKKNHKIQGHEGILKLYKIKEKNILTFSGRRHLYEGLNISEVISNIRLAYELGIKKIIITNAAGGINKKLRTGALMLITGFINLMQGNERGILDGISIPAKRINTGLTKKLHKMFNKQIKSGVYAGVLGPSYETYSEIKLLQKLNADAVGMSTIPEMICANSLGMDYAAISVISNAWSKTHKPSHKEVLKHVNKANNKLSSLISKITA